MPFSFNKLTPRPSQAAPLACEALEDRTLLSAGGGWLGGGIVGSYFANPTESGPPAFVRTDVRLDWASNSLAPGGSRSADPIAADQANFAAVGATSWSASWSGTLVPKYSESYTFQAVAQGGFTMQISPHGQNAWTTLFNQPSPTGTTLVSAPYAMTAWQQYDVQITFSHDSGPWALQLLWSSPSTPLETIDPANPVGIGLTNPTAYYTDFTFANATLSSAPFWQLNASGNGIAFANGKATPVPVDGQSNPTTDFGVFINQMAPEAGTYLVTGFASQQPAVSLWLTSGTVGPVSYNASTHQLSVLVNVAAQNNNPNGGGQGQFALLFTNTAGGVQDLTVMRPSAPGSATPFDPSVRFTPQYESLVSDFSVFRYKDWLRTDGSTVSQWSERTLPTDARPMGNGISWEDVIRFANETGKDLWIDVPQLADDTYVTNLAYLLKYGSDANGNVYTSAQADPYNPPLDPNLRVYVESSNEVWNGLYVAYHQNQAVATQAVVDYIQGVTSAPDYSLGQTLDYDGIANLSSYNGSPGPYDQTGAFPSWIQNAIDQRYHALRTLQISNDFRAVWGDAAMPSGAAGQQPTIRPVLEWQYGGGWYGTDSMLPFLNNYFTNGDGRQDVAIPHPVSYYLYGGGGGWYTWPGDPNGGGVVTVSNNSFENGTTGWAFSGTAGVVANGDPTLHPPSTAPTYTNGNNTYSFGTHAAYLQGAGSFSTTVNVATGDTIDVFFYAGYTGAGDTFNVELDGNVIGSFTPGQVYYGHPFAGGYVNPQNRFPSDLHTLAVQVGPGVHTIAFVGTGPASTSNTTFIDNVLVGTIGGITTSGLTNPATVQSDVALARRYGLADTAYEGGLVFADQHPAYYRATPLQQAAFLDPRATADAVNAIVQVQQYGPDLVNQFGTTSDVYAITDNTFDPNAPVAQAFVQQINLTPPASALARIASSLSHSDEYYQKLITAVYQHYLGRLPDPAGLAAWLAHLKAGLSDEQLEAGFLGSPEYINSHGGPGAGWIRAMYQDLLGRTPGSSEVQGWVRSLANGMTPIQVAYDFAHSDERESERIADDYRQYLLRDPEPGVIQDVWLPFYQSGGSNEDVIASFVSSDEYFARHNRDGNTWLAAAYEDILGRPASAAELQVWQSVLHPG